MKATCFSLADIRAWSGSGVAAALTLLAAALLSGCSTHQLQGVVIRGSVAAIMVVDSDDPRLLSGEPIPEAVVEATLDPSSLGSTPLGRTVSDERGRFSLPVDATGAGMLEYEVEVIAHRPGYQSWQEVLQLPAGWKRVLIVLPPGEDRRRPGQGDILRETMRMGEQLQR